MHEDQFSFRFKTLYQQAGRYIYKKANTGFVLRYFDARPIYGQYLISFIIRLLYLPRILSMPYFENMASSFEKPSEVSVENVLLKDKHLSQSHRTHMYVLSNTLKSSSKVWSGLIKVIW